MHGIEARAHARGPLRRRVPLHLAHDEVPAIAQGVASVAREHRVVADGASREAVVGERGIIVRAARVQRSDGCERLRITGLEAGGNVKQREGGILLPILPRREAVVQQLAHQLAAVGGDVLGALRRKRGRASQRRVGAGHVAHGDVVAAEVVPGRGVRALVALDDGFRQDLLRLGELQVALVGLFRRATQELYPFVNIRVGGYELAGETGCLPAGLSGERDPGESGRKGEHGDARDGTHGG